MTLGSQVAETAGPRSRLHEVFLSGAFAVTSELQTTDGGDPESVFEAAVPLAGKVDAVNCTDNSAAHPHISQVAAGRLLLERGIEPVAQFGCRDRNRLGLQADLLGAHALGIRNVVLMTGDDVTAGDHPEAKPLFDLDAMHLIRIARILRDEGTYLSGRPLSSAPTFLVGAVENPFAPPVEFRPARLEKKIEAGAEFIQTQCIFNLQRMRSFMRAAVDLGCTERAWILAGVYIPRSARAAAYMRDIVPGIDVPEDVVRRLEGVPKQRQEAEALEMTLELCEELRAMEGIAGLHLMSIKGDHLITEAIERLGLLPRPASVDETGAASDRASTG
ncbi:MAG: methylenetetrahydrofolate reductase [Actinomycetota bacterium]